VIRKGKKTSTESKNKKTGNAIPSVQSVIDGYLIIGGLLRIADGCGLWKP
jgi:hypothetical protein